MGMPTESREALQRAPARSAQHHELATCWAPTTVPSARRKRPGAALLQRTRSCPLGRD